MGVKASVFGSRAERANFEKLKNRWGDKYSLWPTLPFLSLFTRKPLFDLDSALLAPLTIDDIDWQRLKKTSIDYVLCDAATDKPIVAIDFDGIQDGFNVGRQYRPSDETPDPWRSLITSLKLKVTHGSLFPYFVVGSRHFDDLSASVRMTIVDGVIGEVLAKNATHARFARGLEPSELGMTQAEWDALPDWDQREFIDNWAIGVEVENDFEHNPIYGEVATLAMEQRVDGGFHRFVVGGPLDDRPFIGAEWTVKTRDVGEVTRTAWIPNFKSPGFTGLGLVEEIAHLMVLEEVRRRRSRLDKR